MKKKSIFLKSVTFGFVAFLFLIGVYLSTTSFISGWQFARSQFLSYWYFLISLALGFGIQIGLYTYLKEEIKNRNASISGKPIAVTGTTSALAMISCCSHYLVNILPVFGAIGIITIIIQYQIQIFWVGLIFNALGISYIINKILKFSAQNKPAFGKEK